MEIEEAQQIVFDYEEYGDGCECGGHTQFHEPCQGCMERPLEEEYEEAKKMLENLERREVI